MSRCVVCSCIEYDKLLDLNCGGFDNSPLYGNVIVASCSNCGHVYNLLTDSQITGLFDYYNNEYSQANIGSPNKNGDTPGSSNKDSLSRYNNLYKIIEKDIKQDSSILDVGCAMGGLLNYLSPYCDNLFGIDSTRNFVEIAKERVKNGEIKLASAESIPLEDNSLDIVFADQVVEHLINPNIFFKEANRVLKDNGILCISVPNVKYYGHTSFFDFYFFLMREHVHHFSSRSLIAIANNSGFGVEYEITTYPNLISDIGKLPNLTIKFRKGAKSSEDSRHDQSKITIPIILRYIQNSYENLRDRKVQFEEILKNGEKINIYGIGREFHYLWENTLLNKCNVALYDDTPIKQKMTVGGNPVLPSDALNLNAKSTMITSFAHIEPMSQKLRNLGFKGEII